MASRAGVRHTTSLPTDTAAVRTFPALVSFTLVVSAGSTRQVAFAASSLRAAHLWGRLRGCGLWWHSVATRC
jgi:hypothetical protein